MAKKDEYIEEAYNELKRLSLDEQKRMEYELRQVVGHMLDAGKSENEISGLIGCEPDEVTGLAEEWRMENEG